MQIGISRGRKQLVEMAAVVKRGDFGSDSSEKRSEPRSRVVRPEQKTDLEIAGLEIDVRVMNVLGAIEVFRARRCCGCRYFRRLSWQTRRRRMGRQIQSPSRGLGRGWEMREKVTRGRCEMQETAEE
jgi:hypothetical protein